MEKKFTWIEFYKEFATKLVEYESRREEVKNIIYEILESCDISTNYLNKNGKQEEDIDPFTIFGTFNRGLTDDNRINILKKIKEVFKIQAPLPSSPFAGVPLLDNRVSVFCSIKTKEKDLIGEFWKFFKVAIEYSDKLYEENKNKFVELFDNCIKVPGIKYNLTFGLFWIRPDTYINLDSKNREFILKTKGFSEDIKNQLKSLEEELTGEKYLNFCNSLKKEIENNRFEFKNFVELSWNAYEKQDNETNYPVWVEYFQEFADKLLEYKNNRKVIADMGMEIFRIIWKDISKFTETGEDPTNLDPFTIFAMFTRTMADESRITFLTKFKEYLNIKADVPKEFPGLPIFSNLHTLFYDINDSNKEVVIDELWNFFEIAIDYSKKENKNNRERFIQSFDKLQTFKGIKTNITCGLFWMRPLNFFYFEGKARYFLTKLNGLNKEAVSTIEGFKNRISGEDYLKICKIINSEIDSRKLDYDNLIELSIAVQRGEVEMDKNKNIILYGPPGTGKTYNSKIYAVAICDGKSIEEVKKEKYEDISKRYAELQEEERIKFTTFHQSYSYEEFIEGIKPCFDEDNKLDYELKDGIFKIFCKKAKEIESKTNLLDEKSVSLEKRAPVIWCVHLTDEKQHLKEYCFDHDEIRIGWNINDEQTADECKDKLSVKNLEERMQIGDIVLIFKNQEGLVDGIGIVESDCNYSADVFPDYPRMRKIRYIKKNEEFDVSDLNNKTKLDVKTVTRPSGMTEENKYLELFKKIGYSEEEYRKELKSIIDKEKEKENPKSYVFIIDEINRGNISKIFGELITLIEESKRLGKPEETLAILPYSGDEFSIPDNLYILGTMNTADRSIAIMDTALRRRFVFKEMMPDSALLEGIKVEDIDIKNMFEIMNKRIAYLYDRDHTIGHSYFIPLKDDNSIENLALIFREKIIPLLQEYFYEDYEKIQLVLGDNQKEDSVKFIIDKKVEKGLFGDSTESFDFSEKVYEIQNGAFLNPDSYIGIYQKTVKD